MSDNNDCSINNNSDCYSSDVSSNGISPHHIIQYRNQMYNISINIVNYNKNCLSSLDVRYIGYFYYVFPLHSNTFHELFYNHSLPGIEKVMFEIHFFNTNLTPVINTQIKSLRQFQSTIKQLDSFVDCDIEQLNKNIADISKFNSFVTNCVKSYLCNYVKCISSHYNSCHKSLKENLKTFDCIKKCVQSMLSQVKGTSGSERYVKHVFSNLLDSKALNTISWINANLPSRKIHLINFYYTHLENFLDESNSVDTTTKELGNVKNDLSQFTAHITTYTNRMQWYIIFWLDRLIKIEYTISRIKNGNGIKDKYDKIKHKVEYCKTSLEFEVQRLDYISNNARMLQNHLGEITGILNKYKTIEDKLKEFKPKLNELKQNKYRSMNYLKWLVRSIETNLCKIQKISNSLNCQRYFVSITTIKNDIENIYSCIKDINNILSVIRSQLIVLDPIKLGIDCKLLNEVECCIKEIVCGIHSKYFCLSSDISKIFTEPSSLPALGENCKLSETVECPSATKTSAQNCGICQDAQGSQSCQCCHALQQLSTSCGDSNIGPKLGSINKVICKLIDDKPKDGCNTGSENQCPHSCPAGQQGQVTSSCQTTQQPENTGNTSCQETNIGELIKSTLNEIKQCQTSPAVKCEGQEDVKCTETLDKTCQITTGTYPTSSSSSGTPGGVESCKELDKVKLCVDTMVNKCNCCQFKKMLNDGKVKCVEVFKWIFIYNFKELFCLYAGYDKSILDYISCSINKLDDITTIMMKLYLSGFGIKYRIDGIKDEINQIPEQLEILENTMKSGIRQMECAIEGVARNLIRCSLQSCIESIRVNVISPSSRNIDSIYNNIKYIKLKCV